MNSLNGHSAVEVKECISVAFGYPVSAIKLHGSRITGGWTDKSDLDVVILDPTKYDSKNPQPLIYKKIFGLKCEIGFVEDFDSSWLRDAI